MGLIEFPLLSIPLGFEGCGERAFNIVLGAWTGVQFNINRSKESEWDALNNSRFGALAAQHLTYAWRVGNDEHELTIMG